MASSMRIPVAALLLVLALTAMARTRSNPPESVRRQVEVSMLLTGTIDIARDGSVTGYAIDNPGQVPQPVTSYLERRLPFWRFEPASLPVGAVAAHTPMSLRMVARPVGDGVFEMSISGVSFGRPGDGTQGVTADRMKPPRYPGEAAMVSGKGIVYLVLLLDRDGGVADLFVEQVNLTAIGTEAEMDRLRQYFSKAAIKAARKWTFHVPSGTGRPGDQRWAVRVPVDFRFVGEPDVQYGAWEAYLPGPRAVAPWAQDGASPDAVATGGIRLVGAGLKLLTPLQEG